MGIRGLDASAERGFTAKSAGIKKNAGAHCFAVFGFEERIFPGGYGVESGAGWGYPRIHMTTKHRIYTTSFASVYPLYVAKAERKGRKKAEVDEIIRWLTGYRQEQLEEVLSGETDFETFFKEAPEMNPSRSLIKGVVCGVRVEDIGEPVMREIRYLDKLVDELAKGKGMGKILRSSG